MLPDSLFDRVAVLLLDSLEHSKKENQSRVESRLDEIVKQMSRQDAGDGSKLQRMLIIDGDRTLTS